MIRIQFGKKWDLETYKFFLKKSRSAHVTGHYPAITLTLNFTQFNWNNFTVYSPKPHKFKVD